MKKILALLIILSYTMPIYAQSSPANKYFEKSYNIESLTDQGYETYVLKKNFLIAGIYIDPNIEYQPWQGFIVKLNQYGDTLFSKKFNNPNYHTGFHHVFPISQNKLALIGYQRPLFLELGDTTSYIYFTDTLGNVLHTKFYNEFRKNYIRKIVKDRDNSFLMGGFLIEDLETGFTDPLLLKTDSLGNVLWHQTYPDYLGNAWIVDIEFSEDNGYYLLLSTKFVFGDGEIVLMKVDSVGNFEWDKTYKLGEECNARTLDLVEDGFLITGEGDDEQGFTKGLAFRLDMDGNILWKNLELGQRCGSAAIQTKDNHLVACFCHNPYIINAPPYDISIAKVNMNGETLWYRHYGGEAAEFGFDIKELEDGGFLICGRTESDSTTIGADLYVIRTNCMGLLTYPEPNFSITQYEVGIVFTNTSQYVYPDSIDGGHFIWDFGDGTQDTVVHPSHTYEEDGHYLVTLTAIVCQDTATYQKTICVNVDSPIPPEANFTYTLNGQQIQLTNTSNNFQNDSFFWGFGDGHTSTLENPTHTYEQAGEYTIGLIVVVCGDTAITTQTIIIEEDGTGVGATNRAYLSIPYPHPLTSQSQIQYELPLAKTSTTFQIIDITGRIVYQQQLITPKGNINLSNKQFQEGLYFCQLMKDGKILTQEKLVVFR